MAEVRTIHALNVVRGVAALLVVFSHSRSYLFQALGADPSGWEKVLLAPTGFAEEAVSVFFVLSGYLVGGQVVRHVAKGHFDWRVYLVKRLSRMWVVLLPALLVTFAADGVSQALFPKVFGAIRGPGGLDLLTAGCNAVFLQSTRCAAYGSNDALWSLSFEFWFYIIFAGATVSVFAVLRNSGARFFVGTLVALGSLAEFGLPLFRLIFPWLVGVAVALIHARWKSSRVPRWVRTRWALFGALGVAAVGVGASAFRMDSYELRFAVVGAAVAPLILVLASGRTDSPVGVRVVGRTGDWSFSTYAYHLPILKLGIVAVVTTLAPNGAFATVLVYALGAFVAVACVPLWFVTEKRTPLVRDWLLARASGRWLTRSYRP